MVKAVDEISSKVQVIDNYTNSIHAMSKKLEDMSPGFQQFDLAVNTTANSFGKLSEFLGNSSDIQAKVLKEQSDVLEGLQKDLREQHDVFSTTLSQHAQNATQQTFEAMKTLAEHHSEMFESFSNQTKEVLTSLNTNRQLTEKEVAKAREATNEFMRQLISMIRTLSDHLSTK